MSFRQLLPLDLITAFVLLLKISFILQPLNTQAEYDESL